MFGIQINTVTTTTVVTACNAPLTLFFILLHTLSTICLNDDNNTKRFILRIINKNNRKTQPNVTKVNKRMNRQNEFYTKQHLKKKTKLFNRQIEYIMCSFKK